ASGVDGMKVYSVRICQAPKSISPFSGSPNVPASPQEVFDAGDVQFDNAFRIKGDSDVFELDSLRTASFYAFENMQGTPLGENDDPWKKMPSSVGSLGTLDPAKAALCTYIEVATRFSLGSKYYGQVVYKLFLGKDAVKNFDIERNHTINVTLKVTEHGFDRDSVSWKIDTLNLFRDKNVRNLTMYLAQKQQRMVIGEIKSLSLDPDVPDVLENGRLKIAYNGSDKESYSISALEVGSDTVYVTLIDPLLSGDNPEGLSNEFVSKMCVDVLAPKLNFRWKNTAVSGAGVRDSVYLAMDGESKTLIPYYTDTSYLHEMKRGDEFDKDLYDQLLSTVIIADSLDSQYIGNKESKTPLSHDIWLQALKSVGAQPLDGHGFGFISVAAVSPDIDTLKCRPYTENPFQDEADKTFESTSLVNSSTDEQFIFPLGQLKEYTGNSDGFYRYRIGTPTQPKGNPCSATLFNGESINIRWFYGSNGDLNIPSQNERFFGIVTNRYSAQEWYSPILYNASFTVHVAIGAVGAYASSAKAPQNWFIQAQWAHPHYNVYDELGASPLAQFDEKIVSTTQIHENDEYIKGVENPLYRLTWYEDVTKVPASLGADFYKTHEPDFGITDVTTYNSDGSVKPDFVDITPDNPYLLPLSGYDVRVHYYKDVSGHPTNWIGVK
ncbi:MAG: hypothetical protein MJY62_05315, partial [Bacteroidales bacterium]|nr:hypothetical protein [Bacteroidales bacterium]